MAADSSPTVVVEKLVKRYGDFQALKGISFSVQPGEIVGFLGPNGAGKTTTMKVLTCFMAASEGSATVAGHSVYDESEAVRRRTGYLPENVPLYDDMMVWDYLHFIAEIRAIPRSERRKAVERVIKQTGLEAMVHRDIGELSKGYRQRVGLAQAIVHEPDVLILDEPTSGLDPNQLVEIRDLIKEIGREKTVIFSTHILQEVAAVCDRIIVIHEGVIVADGLLETLLEESRSDDLEDLFRLLTSEPPTVGEPSDVDESADGENADTSTDPDPDSNGADSGHSDNGDAAEDSEVDEEEE